MKILSIPFHAFLFSLFPLLFLFSENIHEIPLEDIVLPVFLSVLIAAGIWLFLRYFIGGRKSALIISLLLIIWIIVTYIRLLFTDGDYEGLQFLGSNFILIPLSMILGISGIIYIIRKKISNETTSIINVISVVIFSFLIIQIMIYDSNNDFQIEGINKLLQVPILQSNVTDKPDVYLLLLDAYSGDVTLKNDYDFDNSEFKNKLKERGFFVPKTSFSNYPNTELSMPSILNMVYLDFLADELGKDSQNKKVLFDIRTGNNVMNIFQANGYHITTFYGGVHATGSDKNAFETLCGYQFYNLNEDLQRSFVQTYFHVSFLRTILYDNFRYHDLECAFTEFTDFEKQNEKPQFVYTHLFFPHPPFLFDAEGNHVTAKFSTDRFDENLKDAYLQQTIFANKKTIEMVDSIQKRDGDAVIMVMSDHGGRLGVDWYNPTEMDYYRALNNFGAFYFPGQEENMPEEIAAVNVFRTVFNLYLDADYEILEDRQIWYVPERPYDQIDVTEKLRR